MSYCFRSVILLAIFELSISIWGMLDQYSGGFNSCHEQVTPTCSIIFRLFFPLLLLFWSSFFFLNGVFPELWHQLIFSRHFNDLKRSRFLVCLFDWLHLTGNWSELWNSKSVSQQINSLFPLFYHQNSLFDGKFTLPFDWFFLSVQAVGNSLERVKIFF